MGWSSEDGLHEGYCVPLFHDGQRGWGVTGGTIPQGHVVVGGEVEQPDGTWEYPTRPAGEVTGWVICCDCYTRDGFGPSSTWVGPVLTRVPSQALEDVGARRIYATDDDVPYVNERGDVEDTARELWRHEHGFGIDVLSEVEAAHMALASAKRRLDTAVLMARSSGASWADIGRATSMTRQSAQERWRQ